MFLGNGDGTFGAGTIYAVGAFPSGLFAADLNMDGKLDFATANVQGGDISILSGTGDGGFNPATEIAAGPNNGWGAIGDWNGDGRINVAVVSSAANSISLELNSSGWFV